MAPTDRLRPSARLGVDRRTLVNEAMVRRGWAVTYTVPPNVKYAQRLVRAQSEARASGAGLSGSRGLRLPAASVPPGRVRQLTVKLFAMPCIAWGLPSFASGTKQMKP